MEKNAFKKGLEQNLEKLQAFAAVARSGSFHAASRELRLSQPALSRGVMALEAALKTRLFERSRNGVKLTPEGKLLLEFFDRLSGDLSNLERKIKNPADSQAGVIKIGTFESLAFYLWPKVLKTLQAEVPSLTLRLVSGDESELRTRLLAGSIQMVVEAEPLPDERVRSVVLYRDRFGIYRRPELPRASAAPPESITYVPKARDQSGRSIRDHLLSVGVDPERAAYELDTFSSAQEFALAGLGVVVLPKRLARKQVLQGKLLPAGMAGLPAQGFGEHRICASFLEENRTDPRIKLVLARLSRSQ